MSRAPVMQPQTVNGFLTLPSTASSTGQYAAFGRPLPAYYAKAPGRQPLQPITVQPGDWAQSWAFTAPPTSNCSNLGCSCNEASPTTSQITSYTIPHPILTQPTRPPPTSSYPASGYSYNHALSPTTQYSQSAMNNIVSPHAGLMMSKALTLYDPTTSVRRFLQSLTPNLENLLPTFIRLGITNHEALTAFKTWRSEERETLLKGKLNDFQVLAVQNSLRD